MITHLEPDILEFKVKWALGSITMNKASGGDGIPVKPFQTLNDDAVKALYSICQKIWKTQQWPQDWKMVMMLIIPVPKKDNAKECSNYCTIALFSHTSKVMLKILQARLQQYMNCELPDVQDPDNHDGVITHLEPDVLECEVKCPLESITRNKASGGDGIPVELFKILKDDAVKVLHSI